MKSARIPKYISIPLIVVIIGIGLFTLGILDKSSVTTAIIAAHIDPFFRSYIKENRSFPISEIDLISKGYITIYKDENKGDQYRWYPRPSDQKYFPENFYYDLPRFKSFVFYYGFNPQDVELKDGKLYHKTTKKQILLIQGTDDVFLGKLYEKVSRNWYLLLMEGER